MMNLNMGGHQITHKNIMIKKKQTNNNNNNNKMKEVR